MKSTHRTSRILYIATVLGDKDWDGFLDAKYLALKDEWTASNGCGGGVQGGRSGGFCMIGVTPTATYYGTETQALALVPPTLSDAEWESGTTVFRTSPKPEILSNPPEWMMDVVLLRKLVAKSYIPGKTHLVIGTHSLGDCFQFADVLVENTQTPDPQHYSIVAPPRFKYQVKERYQYPSEEFFADVFSKCVEGEDSKNPSTPNFLTVTLDSCFMGELHTIAAVWRQLRTPYLLTTQGWMWADDKDMSKSIFSPVAARNLWSIVSTRMTSAQEKLKEILEVYCDGSDNPADGGLYNTKAASELLSLLSSERFSGSEQEETWKEWQKIAQQRFHVYIRDNAKRLNLPKWATLAEQQLKLHNYNGEGGAPHRQSCGGCCNSSSFDFSQSHNLNPQFNFYANTDDTGFYAGWLVEGQAVLNSLFSLASNDTANSNATIANDDTLRRQQLSQKLARETVRFHIKPNKMSAYAPNMQPSSFSISLRRNVFNAEQQSLAYRSYAFMPEALNTDIVQKPSFFLLLFIFSPQCWGFVAHLNRPRKLAKSFTYVNSFSLSPFYKPLYSQPAAEAVTAPRILSRHHHCSIEQRTKEEHTSTVCIISPSFGYNNKAGGISL